MYPIYYHHIEGEVIRCITVDNLEDAQLVWDTFNYLRNQYKMDCERPK